MTRVKIFRWAALITIFVGQISFAQTTATPYRDLIQLLAIDKAIAAISEQAESTATHFGAELKHPQQQQLLASLQQAFDPAGLEQQLYQRLEARQYNGDSQGIQTLLDSELAKRVRNFEIGMQLPGKIENAIQYHKDKGADKASAVRTALLRKIDQHTATSTILFLGQKALRTKALQQIGKDQSIHFNELQQRAFVEELSLNWFAFAYRYLKDDELLAYEQLLANAQVQQHLNDIVTALEQSLAAIE